MNTRIKDIGRWNVKIFVNQDIQKAPSSARNDRQVKSSNKAIKIEAIKESKKPSKKRSSIKKKKQIVILIKSVSNIQGQIKH